MCATLAGTPSLSLRRKSITRYARLWPPPWCRVVIRPVLLRPPLLCSGRTSDFSGAVRVTSTKSATLEPRRPGVVGLYLRIPIYIPSLFAQALIAEFAPLLGPQAALRCSLIRISPLRCRSAEDLDPVTLAKGDDGALDVLARAVAESGPLALALPVEGVHVGYLDVEHL